MFVVDFVKGKISQIIGVNHQYKENTQSLIYPLAPLNKRIHYKLNQKALNCGALEERKFKISRQTPPALGLRTLISSTLLSIIHRVKVPLNWRKCWFNL